MDKTISYVDFQKAWVDWQVFYYANNPCPYANSGECPEPCPVSDEQRSQVAIRLWNKWWKSLPDEHWLREHELVEGVEWIVVDGGVE